MTTTLSAPAIATTGPDQPQEFSCETLRYAWYKLVEKLRHKSCKQLNDISYRGKRHVNTGPGVTCEHTGKTPVRIDYACYTDSALSCVLAVSVITDDGIEYIDHLHAGDSYKTDDIVIVAGSMHAWDILKGLFLEQLKTINR